MLFIPILRWKEKFDDGVKGRVDKEMSAGVIYVFLPLLLPLHLNCRESHLLSTQLVPVMTSLPNSSQLVGKLSLEPHRRSTQA